LNSFLFVRLAIKSASLAPALLAALLAAPSFAQAAGTESPSSKERPEYRIPRSSGAIAIDGRIDAAEWAGALAIPLDNEIDPGKNVPAPVQTTAYLLYDSSYLYAAFRAEDPEPSALRAHLADRDTPFRDDFVGLFLDTFNDERRGYEFFVNPFGVQMDFTLDETAADDKESAAWDGIWHSAGHPDEHGYVVEIAIPYSTLRFQRSAGEQTWGVEPFRSYPRSLRHQITSVPFDPNDNCTLCQISKMTGFEGATPGRNFEVDPTATAHRTDVRQDSPNGGIASGSVESEAGLTARWGITPNLSLVGTINPDFSQVEADAAQLAVNTDFSLFYSEKRPFFLEGFDFFSTPFNAVNTRTVADPKWGLKLAGKEGRHGLGVFVAEDDSTSLLLPGSLSSRTTRIEGPSRDGAVRYRTDLGRNANVGALFTHRDGGDYQNDLFGLDGSLRPTPSDRVTFQLLSSRSDLPSSLAAETLASPGDGSLGGSALRVGYNHESKNWTWYARHEAVGREFRADLGFMPRVGYDFKLAGIEHTWWAAKPTWYTRYSAGIDWDRTRDANDTTLEDELEAWLILRGARQSFFLIDAGTRDRFWNGRTFDQRYVNLELEMRPTGAISFSIGSTLGDTIDFVNTRAAKQVRLDPTITWEAGKRLRLTLQHNYQHLDVDEGRLFTANLSQLRAVYQLNLRAFVRTIFQYTNIERDAQLYTTSVAQRDENLFTQLLFAYKLNPQTVLFLGYSDNQIGGENLDLTRSDRTLFLKLGYALVL